VTHDLLIEIGVENLPASYVRPAVDQLRSSLEAWLSGERLSFGSVYAAGTPRRIAVIVGGLSNRQAASEELVTGPPVARAFDALGAPTKAAEGFARSVSVEVGALERVQTPKGEYLGFRRPLRRSPVAALLGEHLPALLAAIRFPKTMKWEPSGVRFARPVRWIVCMYGGTVVRFRFAGVESGSRTYARPWLPGRGVVLRGAGDYRAATARLGVIVDDAERRSRIEELAARAASRLGLRVVADPDLVTELTYMLEDPRVLVGEFPAPYLSLPPEVVTTAMRSHQRYLALTDEKGGLVAKFMTFTDGKVLAPAEVRRGNEKVLNARLADAQFYWNEDVRHGVEVLSRELDRIVFIEGLGTIGARWRRMERLALSLNARLTRMERADEGHLRRATRLSKCDLASEMVKDGKEFTKLQGLIGSHYAREAGEAPAVVAAIREHYQPRTPSDPPPQSTAAAVIGVADRIDTVCGCFIAGFIPTGSQDPYALRRLANGLIRILRDEPGVRLDELIAESMGLYAESGVASAESIERARGGIVDFFKARCEAFLKDNGVPYDVADAVKATAWAQPGMALDRGREIAKLRGDTRFERLITGVKRVSNILAPSHRLLGVDWDRIEGALAERAPMADGLEFRADRFEDAREGDLLAALRVAAPAIRDAEASHNVRAVLTLLSGLADPIDGYFDQVLVNCDDAAVRANRHGFLSIVYALFSRCADFSEIVEPGTPAPPGSGE
jgi:glycyl-tRNA synthetase beta chain